MGGSQSSSRNKSPYEDTHEDRSSKQDSNMKGNNNEAPPVDSHEDCSNTQNRRTTKSSSNETLSENLYKDRSIEQETSIKSSGNETPLEHSCEEKRFLCESTEEKRLEESDFISVSKMDDDMKEYLKSVCEIEFETNERQATGFLAKFLCNNTFIYGLFTNNHVIDKPRLNDPNNCIYLKFECRKKRLKLCWNNTFRFTCPVLDVTFIHLENLYTKIEDEFDCKFLSYHLNWMGKEGNQLQILQYPTGFSDLQSASGTVYKMHGFDILHKVSTDYCSSGSPVVCDGKVIGIHKSRAADPIDQYNHAVSAEAILDALYQFKPFSRKLIVNPQKLDENYEEQLLQQNVTKEDNSWKHGCIYSHDTTSSKIPSIWFVPTSHGWYWTSTSPYNDKIDLYWMSVEDSKILEDNSELNGKNIEIFNWLCENKIPMQE